MTKGQAAITAVIVLLVATAAGHLLGFLLGLLIVGVPYAISIRLHPRTRHLGWRSCKGSGEHRGAILKWGHRRCPKCDGGRLVRAGNTVFGSPRMRREYWGRKEARKTAKKEHRWR